MSAELREKRLAAEALHVLMKQAQRAPTGLRKNAPTRGGTHPWALTLGAPPRPVGERLGDELLQTVRADVIPFRKAAPPPRSPAPRPPTRHPWPAAAKLATASMTKLKPRTL